MTQEYDLEVAGPLNLNAHLSIANDTELRATGRFGFSLTDSLNQTLSLLPFGLGKKLASGMVQKHLNTGGYSFEIKTQVNTNIVVDPEGLMTLTTHYHSPFAKVITHNEFERVFNRFAQELFYVGIQPSSADYLKDFIHTFKRHNQAQLHFAHLFLGKHLAIDALPPHELADFTIDEVNMGQDAQGDLTVDFVATAILKPTHS
jgi:hypothetical protein